MHALRFQFHCILLSILTVCARRIQAGTVHTNSTTYGDDDVSSLPKPTSRSSLRSPTSNGLGGYIVQGLANQPASSSTSRILSFDTRQTIKPIMSQDATFSPTPSSSSTNGSIAPTRADIKVASDYFNLLPSGGESAQVFSQATQCWSELISWGSSSVSWYNTHVANHTWPWTSTLEVVTKTYSATQTLYPGNVSTYKLCDGTPRANARPSTISSTWTSIYTTFVNTWLSTPIYPPPQPCTPTAEECHIWYHNSSIRLVDDDFLAGICGYPPHLDSPCNFWLDGAVQLFYFPVKIADEDDTLCLGTRSTITAGNEPSVVTTLGYTFTSGSVYLSVKSLSAYAGDFGYPIGPNFTDLMLTLASSDVSSQCGGNGIPTSLNWADLNWPVPASAYSCQLPCGLIGTHTVKECWTIWSNVNPLLAIPTKVRDLSPQWATCGFDHDDLVNYWFDPPIGLQQASVAATATMPSALFTAPATPSPTPNSPTPSATQPATIPEPSATPTAISKTIQEILSSSTSETQSTTAVSEDDSSLSSSTSSIDSALSTFAASSILTATLSFSTSVLDPDPTIVPSGIALSVGSETTSAIQSDNDFVLATTTLSVVQVATIAENTFTQGTNAPALVSTSSQKIVSLPVTASRSTLSQKIFSFPGKVSQSTPSRKTVPLPVTASSSTSSISLPAVVPPPESSVVVADNLTLTISSLSNATGVVAIGQTTLSVGGPAATIRGKIVTEASRGLIIAGPGTTAAFSAVPSSSSSADDDAYRDRIIYALGSMTVAAVAIPGDSSAVAVDAVTLSLGGPAAVIGSATVTLGLSGIELVESGGTMVSLSAVASLMGLPSVALGMDSSSSSTGSGRESGTSLATSTTTPTTMVAKSAAAPVTVAGLRYLIASCLLMWYYF